MKILCFIALLLLSQLSFAASSQQERADKKFQFTIQQGYDYKTTSTSGSLSYFIDGDNLIGVRGGGGRSGDDHQTHFSLQSKHFFGNSFYLSPEIYYLNYFETDNDDDFNLLDSKDEKLQSVGLSFRIGNQWQLKNFVIGCDWIGLGRGFARWKRTEDTFSNELTFTLLNFYVGASF